VFDLTYNDLRRFVAIHGPGLAGAEPDHNVQVVATDQVHLVCLDCGFDVTVDAVNAGLPCDFGDEGVVQSGREAR